MIAEPHSVPLSGSPPLEASFSPFLLRDTLVFILSVVLRHENSSPPRSPTYEPSSLLRQTSLSLAPSFAARAGRRAAQLATLDTATPPNQHTPPKTRRNSAASPIWRSSAPHCPDTDGAWPVASGTSRLTGSPSDRLTPSTNAFPAAQSARALWRENDTF